MVTGRGRTLLAPPDAREVCRVRLGCPLEQVQHAPPPVGARAESRDLLRQIRSVAACEAARPRARGLAVHVARTIEFRPERRPTRFNARQSRDTLAVPRREVPRTYLGIALVFLQVWGTVTARPLPSLKYQFGNLRAAPPATCTPTVPLL